jgi:hypothetical protein
MTTVYPNKKLHMAGNNNFALTLMLENKIAQHN